ncbi:MAG: Na(+)-translocating NADH-quinone reductase subunit C [Xanthomonadales bacterium]|nr:Na(+)-translocating NADH-quinone reductase subunit C [Xanthomonadales bacterium]
MNRDSPSKAVMVVLIVAVVSSALVAGVVTVLRPIQLENQLLERARHVLQLTGLIAQGELPGEDRMLELYRRLDIRMVDLRGGSFEADMDPASFDARRAANDPERSVAIPPEQDRAGLGRRSRYARVFLVWEGDELQRVILPIHGAGMWSTIYGYLALEPDLNTIAGVTFYEQNETPGIGDRILQPAWRAQWEGRKLFDPRGEFRFDAGPGRIEPGTEAARYKVDALTGATVTVDAVIAMMHYWMGPHGYQPLIERLRVEPPSPRGGEDR